MNALLNNKRRILALDTSTSETCACLCVGSDTSMASLGSDQRMRSAGILPLLTGLLKEANVCWTDLTALAFSQGPGSFTGLRIGAATLAGINAGMQLPVLHISSLAVTARQVNDLDPIRVLEDARAGEVFSGLYQAGESLEPDQCMSWQEAHESLSPGKCVSISPVPDELTGWKQQPLKLDRAKALALQVQTEWSQIRDDQRLPIYPAPVYLQLSQAERSANGR